METNSLNDITAQPSDSLDTTTYTNNEQYQDQEILEGEQDNITEEEEDDGFLKEEQLIELLQSCVTRIHYNAFMFISAESTIEILGATAALLAATEPHFHLGLYETVKAESIEEICENIRTILGEGSEDINFKRLARSLNNIADTRHGDYVLFLRSFPEKLSLNRFAIVTDMYSLSATGYWEPVDVFGNENVLEQISYDDLKILTYEMEQLIIISDTFVGNINQGVCQLQELLSFQLAFFKSVHVAIQKNYNTGKSVQKLINKCFERRYNDIISAQRGINQSLSSSKLMRIDKNFVDKTVDHIRNTVGTKQFSEIIYVAINRLINTQAERVERYPVPDMLRMNVKNRINITAACDSKKFYSSVETIISQWNSFVQNALISDKSNYMLRITSKYVVNILV